MYLNSLVPHHGLNKKGVDHDAKAECPTFSSNQLPKLLFQIKQ